MSCDLSLTIDPALRLLVLKSYLGYVLETVWYRNLILGRGIELRV